MQNWILQISEDTGMPKRTTKLLPLMISKAPCGEDLQLLFNTSVSLATQVLNCLAVVDFLYKTFIGFLQEVQE